MKKLCFMLLAACLLFSCAKEEVHSSIQQVEQIEKDGVSGKDTPTVKDGYLIFDCEQSMEDFIVGLADAEADPKQIGKTYNFRSYLNHVTEIEENEGIFGDEYFAGVLNENGMIAVGSYIFKMNPATEEVFVLDSNSPKEEIDQMSTASNTNELSSKTLSFSFDDDIFEMLDDRDSGCTVQALWGCGENCSGSKKHLVQRIPYCTTKEGRGNFELLARYRTIGIWKWMKYEFGHDHSIPMQEIGYDLRFTAKWKRRCRAWRYSEHDYVCSNIPSGDQDECFPEENFYQILRFHRSTRCLSAFLLRVDVRLQNACTNELFWTGFAKIETIL